MVNANETTVKMTIDGQEISVPKSYTILQAARMVGMDIPHLCYHPELSREGSCRVCVVAVEGAKSLVASCVYPVAEGMIVHTNTPQVRETRKTIVELMLANHPEDCLFCVKNNNCELQKIAEHPVHAAGSAAQSQAAVGPEAQGPDADPLADSGPALLGGGIGPALYEPGP